MSIKDYQKDAELKENWSLLEAKTKKHTNQKVLDSFITTLLFIIWNQQHYAVIRVDILSNMVTLWDVTYTPNMDRVKDMIGFWQKHINYALAAHLPNQVMKNRGNIVSMEDASANNTPFWEKDKTHYPLWKIDCAMPVYLQRDVYTCGAIALI